MGDEVEQEEEACSQWHLQEGWGSTYLQNPHPRMAQVLDRSPLTGLTEGSGG